MRRAAKIFAIVLALVLGVPALLIAIVLAGGNTGPGRVLIARLVPALTGREVALAGLSGRFPDRLRVARVELRDAKGVWAHADDVVLDWSPLRLIDGTLAITRLNAARVAVARQPVSSGGGSSGGLPVAVDIDALRVARLDLGAAVAGAPAAAALDGSLALTALDRGRVALHVSGIGVGGIGVGGIGGGDYRLAATLTPAAITARFTGGEPAQGLIGRIAGLPDLGALHVDARVDGPQSGLTTRLAVGAGKLRADAHGTVNLKHRAADLFIAATAPAMAPRPDLAWRSVALHGELHGAFTQPHVDGTIDVASLRAAGAAIDRITARIAGDSGRVGLQATIAGAHLPGPQPDLLAANPITIDAALHLDQPDRPLRFAVEHKLFTAAGNAATAGKIGGRMTLDLPDLAPLAALGGVDLQGHATLAFDTERQGATTRLNGDGTIAVTGGAVPLPALVGGAARLELSAALTGSEITISRFSLAGAALRVKASGQVSPAAIALDWEVALSDLARITPRLNGAVDVQGHLGGKPDDLAVGATLAGTVAPAGMAASPLNATIQVSGLPGAPSGTIRAHGGFAGAPIALDLAATRAATGGLTVKINRADWKSAHAQGGFTLAPGAKFPLGTLDLRMTRLADLQPLTGQRLAGAIAATLATAEADGHQRTKFHFAARDLAVPGAASNGRVTLDAAIADPLTRPVLTSRLDIAGTSATGVAASARLDLNGPQQAMAMRLSGEIKDISGAPISLTSAATLDATRRSAALSALQAQWKGIDLRLLAPARFGFADGITVDRLRLGVGHAGSARGIIEAAGRLSPTLALTVALRDVPAGLASAFVPGLSAGGTIRGSAKLSGTPAQPTGPITLTATGLHLLSGPGEALPPANLTATADLAGESARVDARLTAGSGTSLRITGRVATAPAAPLDLHGDGTLDLAMLNPLLVADGRRAAGRVTVHGGVTGTLAAPQITGGATLAGGEFEDYTLGAHLTKISATVNGAGTALRLVRLQAGAGPGTITAHGTIDLGGAGMPVDLAITARNAQPLASDLLTAAFNADLTLRGGLSGGLQSGGLQAAGTVDITHAEIGIPKTMPVQVPVLDVRKPGAVPPPPARGPAVGLNLRLRARRVTVRGRGIFAELAGAVRVTGSAAAPQPLGGFHMVRGDLSLAGQTLRFNKGQVSFNGGSLTDPSLDFEASSANSTMTAVLSITGTASHPKITLSSTPEVPQDEILAQLLFNRSASSLSPFELASVASTLAELTGVTSGIGDPLAGVRSGLGLQRLSIGSSASGAPTLQAGRYVAPGVYLGAQQGGGSGSSQARVEIDITKGLKAIGTVGTGSNATPGATPADSAGTSLGLKYQFEY